VRVCSECGVVTPLTGAQNVRPLAPLVSQGGRNRAGFTVAASPCGPATGRVSFQPARLTGLGGAGLGGDPGWFEQDDSPAHSKAAASAAVSLVGVLALMTLVESIGVDLFTAWGVGTGVSLP